MKKTSKTKLEAFKREKRKMRMCHKFCILDDSKIRGAEKLITSARFAGLALLARSVRL